MENKKLLEKYCHGNHWEIRPVIYAEEFMSFLRRNKLNDTQVIVDLGCGNGRDVDYFTEIGLTAIGIDNDSEIIQSAKKKYRRNKTDFFICDIERSLYPDNTISLYFCINVMHYVNQEMVLKEIHRTLKPGGYAFIHFNLCLLYTSPSPRDRQKSRMPSSA